MKSDQTIDLSYQQAYQTKEEALESIWEVSGELYNLFPKYSYKHKGTIYHLLVNEHNSFLYYFLALGSYINGFIQSIRLVIAVYETHLKSKYKRTMLVATSLDGNNQIYSVTIRIVDSENDASLEWFIINLRGVIRDVP